MFHRHGGGNGGCNRSGFVWLVGCSPQPVISVRIKQLSPSHFDLKLMVEDYGGVRPG
ncbi:hypothetical protein DY000_02040814 [Brassica cretica]|uniref:Expansin-like EG45 domain-containing protein n=1 Tax=Brassica cretica TaxID=69181 RepID=A0ABQ7BL71_BRACR|nr:hypothetical protein DY000_02040814 [Brassica cretica]